MEALVVIEGIVIALLVVLVAGLLRSHAEILRRLHALGGGEDFSHRETWTPATLRQSGNKGTTPVSIAGTTPTGGVTNLALSGSRGLTLLAFLSTGCTSCRPFWEQFERVTVGGEEVRPVIVTKGPAEESPHQVNQMSPADVTTVMSSDAWDTFQVPATPYFVLVDTAVGSTIGEGAAGSWAHLAELLGRAVGDAARPIGRSTRARSMEVDGDLTRAGIEPGDPSLYQRPVESTE